MVTGRHQIRGSRRTLIATSSRFDFDNDNNAVVLFPTEWALGYFNQTHPKIVLILAAGARLCRVRRDQPQQRNKVFWCVEIPGCIGGMPKGCTSSRKRVETPAPPTCVT